MSLDRAPLRSFCAHHGASMSRLEAIPEPEIGTEPEFD
jgi:hypothetical protein